MNEKVIDCNDGCKMHFFSNAEFADYSAAVIGAKARGLKCYDTFTVRDNYHSIYTAADHVEIIYYTGHSKELRVIVDPNTEMFDREPFGQVYTADSLPSGERALEEAEDKCTLYQFETDYRTVDCGMFYAIKCSDGTFFLIDSAERRSPTDHIRIHDFLRRLTPEGEKIHICGWFLSHAHNDHVDKFMDFVSYGFDDVVIDMLYYNFPSSGSDTAGAWKESDKKTMREFEVFMAEHKELRRIKLHTGEHFFVHGLEFIVLATFEDIYPGEITWFNDSSTVLLMRAGGTTVFWAGDAGGLEADIIHARYGAAVKSDILQLAHHGYIGGSTGLYRLIDAPTILFPNSRANLEKSMEKPTTVAALQIAKEYFFAGDGVTELKLPYSVGEAVVHLPEINT